jgi:hypothetical protein
MNKAKNIIVYNYGGDKQDSHHFTSIQEGVISRTGNKGLKLSNRQPGDYVLITSRVGNVPQGDLRVSSGIYLGVDTSGIDHWNDPEAGYDRSCVEKFKYISTITIPSAELTTSRRFLNDNGKVSNQVLEQTLVSK